MSKSIAELRQSPHVGLPERTQPICVAGRLVAEIAELDQEFFAAVEDEENKPKRVGSKSKAQEIAKKADAIRAQMEEHTVQVRLRARENGEWRRWCDKHPAREDNDRDKLYGVGICNSDDLIADLATYVIKIGDDTLGDGDWAFISANASPGDLLSLARVVMGMHESAVDLPKSRTAWLRARTKDTDSE